MVLQGVLGDDGDQSAGSAPAAESHGPPTSDASSMPSSSAAPEPVQSRPSSDEDLNDWPILREGEGGKLVTALLSKSSTPLLNVPSKSLQEECVRVVIWKPGRLMPGIVEEGEYDALCVAGASPASRPEPARVPLWGGRDCLVAVWLRHVQLPPDFSGTQLKSPLFPVLFKISCQQPSKDLLVPCA